MSLDDPLRHRSPFGSVSGRLDACCEALLRNDRCDVCARLSAAYKKATRRNVELAKALHQWLDKQSIAAISAEIEEAEAIWREARRALAEHFDTHP